MSCSISDSEEEITFLTNESDPNDDKSFDHFTHLITYSMSYLAIATAGCC